jgi:hypothetical protein
MGPVQSFSVEKGETMRLSWGQTVAGGLTLAVVAGLFLLPGRLLGPDRPVALAVPAAHGAVSSVQAVPPLAIRRLRPTRSKTSAGPSSAVVSTPAARTTYVAPVRAAVRVSPARRVLKAHRSAVISKLAPTAPLVRARVLAAAVQQRALQPKPAKTVSPTAKTIAALAASLRKK